MITDKQAQALLALDYFGYANHGYVYGLHGEVIDELDTLGYVTVGITDAKKHYPITDTGRIALEEFAGTQTQPLDLRTDAEWMSDRLTALEAENAALRALLLAAGDALAPVAVSVNDPDVVDETDACMLCIEILRDDEYVQVGLRATNEAKYDVLRVQHLRALAAVAAQIAAQIAAQKGEG